MELDLLVVSHENTVEFAALTTNYIYICLWRKNSHCLRFHDVKLFSTSGTFTGFAIPHSKGGYVAAVGNKIMHFQWEAPSEAKVLAEVEKGLPNRFNDAKCDSRGRLFAGEYTIYVVIYSLQDALKILPDKTGRFIG
jgi:sugar lactone lactonase YvrE